MKKFRLNAGFTLVELLIVVLIVGILARLAYPNYLNATLKSGRADAKVALGEVAQRLQRCFTTGNKFNPSTTGACTIYDSIKSSASGFTSSEGFYVIKEAQANDVSATSFIITAAPVSTKRQSKDTKCAKLTLTHTGVRAAYDSGGTDTTSECW
ncbi:type IV pilin protein [Cellvibrio sp.]|uniref:type IV pilin protein n=1 Tax=Cellvibrio sp. TaxID=1965322 RepID=UPI0039647F27